MMTTERLDGLAAYFGSAAEGSAKITNGLPPVVLANVAFRRQHEKEFRAMSNERDAVWGVRPIGWHDVPEPPPR